MNRKLNQLSKIGILHLLALFLLFSCENEQFESLQSENLQDTNGFKMKTVFKHEMSENKALTKTLVDMQQLESSASNERGIYNSTLDFYIETDKAVFLENEDYHSYTFSIYRSPENLLTENLILSLQADLSYKAYLATYNFTEHDIELVQNNQPVNLVDKVTILPLEDFDSDTLMTSFSRVSDNGNYCYKMVQAVDSATGWTFWKAELIDCPQNIEEDPTGSGGGSSATTPTYPDPWGDDPVEDPNDNYVGGGSDAGNDNTNNPNNNNSSNPDENTNQIDDCLLVDENGNCIALASKPLTGFKVSAVLSDCLGADSPAYYNAYQISYEQRYAVANFIDTSGCGYQNKSLVQQSIELLKENEDLDFEDLEQFLNGMDKDCQSIAIFRSISKTKGNSDFTQKIWNHFFKNSSTNHINIQDEPLPGNTGALVGLELVSDNGYDDVVIMQFDNTYLDTATTLGFVNTFYHELVHAYIVNLYHNGTLLTEYPNYTDLKTSMDNLFTDTNNTAFKEVYKQESHNIYTDFIDDLAEAIVAYSSYANISGVDLTYARKLVWGGLNGNNIFTENLTITEQLEAQTLLAYENSNTGAKKGTKTCN